jgi:hypothetical protein
MQTDKWGRQFLDGEEDGPADLRCIKCNQVCYQQGNPFGTTVFEFSRGDDPNGISAFAFCDPCAVKFWEWVTPMLTTNPAYIAARDQHMAAIPEFIKRWNALAPEEWQREAL